MNISEIMRTGHVKRWHIVRVGREQTIAEHMYRVWAICRAFGEAMKFSAHRKARLEEMALIHDRAEVVMGDIPSPTKDALDSGNLEPYEMRIDQEWVTFKYHIAHTDPILIDLLKLADLLEAIAFLNEEAISRHAIEVRRGLDDQWRDLFQKVSDTYKHERIQGLIEVHQQMQLGMR